MMSVITILVFLFAVQIGPHLTSSSEVIEILDQQCPFLDKVGNSSGAALRGYLDQIELSLRPLCDVPNRTLAEAARSLEGRIVGLTKQITSDRSGSSQAIAKERRELRRVELLGEKFTYINHVLFVPLKSVSIRTFLPGHHPETPGIHGSMVDATYPFRMDGSGHLQKLGVFGWPSSTDSYYPYWEFQKFARLFPRRKRWWK